MTDDKHRWPVSESGNRSDSDRDAMDAHNSFEKSNIIQPAPFSGKVSNGKLVFDLPGKAVAVVQVQ
ncbi:hypothetical protein [Bradyrhizobium arachidis]|uniref:hypothetical protein n=1 Tax=Bradyrhizobium arachidis TaxID=858423 RepID=UPI00216178AD|nr:hypothetical protein [Bradyrhizobium arachidis]UVO30341.1 hypothetical protein KUF59_06255 [Bradyrhizobium arachidis]